MKPQSQKSKLAAGMALDLLDAIEHSRAGNKDGGWTLDKIADSRKTLQEIIDAPYLPDNVWHDQIPKREV